MDYLLGIDLGTSSVRVILIDTEGKVCSLAGEEYPILYPEPNAAEQNPDHWWEATCRTIHKILQETTISPSSIAGIGLSGQMHGLVAIDGKGKLLHPAIIWVDKRSVQECEEIKKKIGEEKLYLITGNPVAAGFLGPSLLWLRKQEPEVFRRIYQVLPPKDYLRWKLTGEIATEPTDAVGTALFDVQKGDWATEILTALDLPRKIMPDILPSDQVGGRITPAAASETGLMAGTPVILGGGDQAMGAIGNGVVSPGVAASTIGTGGQLVVCIDQPQFDPGRRLHLLVHAMPRRWLLMGAMLSAGLSLRWLRDQVFPLEKLMAESLGIDPYELFSREAEKVPVGSQGLLFLPYLSGERTPHMDPYARGVFFGLKLEHHRGHIIRAVMEGVAFGLRDSWEIFQSLEVKIHRLIASGGGARSRVWRQIQADILGTTLFVSDKPEHSALGAAILAGVGVNIYPDLETACRKYISYTQETSPFLENKKKYDQYYLIYRSLYPQLRESFQELNQITESLSRE